MKLKLKINRHTTESEFIHLGMFFTALGLNAGTKVVSFAPPTDAAELDEPEGETIVRPATEEEIAIDKAAGVEPPKRRRRTKAEIEAEIAEREAANKLDAVIAENSRVAAAEAEAQTSNEAGLKALEGEAGNVQPAPTPTAPETTNGAVETPATESPSDGKTYTAAEVQQQATVVARTHGADLVKAKIAELGGARIADLNAEQVNTLGAYLFSVK